MRFVSFLIKTAHLLVLHASLGLSAASQIPLVHNQQPHGYDRDVSPKLFSELEELARLVDIAYCVGLTNTGISKPFECLSRCSQFPNFELIKTWNTGPLLSDSCGYIALDHSATLPRIIVAFRGTYSIVNAVVDLSTVPQAYIPYPGDPGSLGVEKYLPELNGDVETPKCDNCTVHTGFYEAWRVTSKTIKPVLDSLVAAYPAYKLHLVGHSLGGAVATLAGLDFMSAGWRPTVTTYGEPRIGNSALMAYIDARFNLNARPLDSPSLRAYEDDLAFRRVTHVDDPVPQLPLSEWGFRMHAGEIFIAKQQLSPGLQDMRHCFGDEDPSCIAGQDASLGSSSADATFPKMMTPKDAGQHVASVVTEAALFRSTGGGFTVPARYQLWQMLFAHRDYFWRLGLCIPDGGPWN